MFMNMTIKFNLQGVIIKIVKQSIEHTTYKCTRKIKIFLTCRPNNDKTLTISHIISVTFHQLKVYCSYTPCIRVKTVAAL